MNRRHFTFGLAAMAAYTGAALPAHAVSELKMERDAQAGMPRSADPLWSKLRACKVGYNARTGLYSLTPTPDVQALVGQKLRIKGFILPLDGLDMTRHFLIGVNTPVCLFHPPGEPNEVIEVKSLRPVRWTESQTAIQGQFNLIKNAEMGVFFAMSQASPV